MRFVKAKVEGGPRVGIVRDDDVVLLSREVVALEHYFGDDGSKLHDLGEAIASDPLTELAFGDLELAAPVQPTSVRDFMTFEQHILPAWRAAGLERGLDVWYERPIGYFSNAASLLGPCDPVVTPSATARLDFELEVGAIVGRAARSVSPSEAANYIAGYLIFCDWSARDVQAREMEGHLGPFKGKDFAGSLGPIFVTPDHIADYRRGRGYDLEMISTVNGRVYGRDVWASASWSMEELISYASWDSAIEQGGLIATGTCGGGCILELSLRHSDGEHPWLVPGDKVNLGIKLMGEIDAEVVAPVRESWPGMRRVVHDGGVRKVLESAL
jgi:2-keto-4-pentenoate hydratase/2-oxohepta-3-ene-1,7-dioic acid hydratase in catechol pathway